MLASSFDELNKKCGYGVIMKEECRPIDIISGFTEESWQIKSYQVGGYLNRGFERNSICDKI